ncbi:MAG: hypothetical protein SH868_16720 [Bythopirellula sp.]|nr:hypothetical protein [Bythopirellula sp.]
MGFINAVLGLLFLVVGVLFTAVATTFYFQEQESGAIWFAGIIAILLLVVGSNLMSSKKSKSWKADPATDKQKEFADDLGIKYPKDITKGELSALISQVTGK